ncbi:hypothetical protein VE01_03709 [Pseudogymnoascus verrucosus]|uniref:tRNA(Phe) (4-demethylwyosine(37)-C(7)) aminocarboxypropyltransferase n=1 Tax=Pseudogymnoascus verrucosus TaxID=342668 RepID=A0A1B8GQG3_9PEZI|nr:uncharacterized protein VE01_03709 [Pseudogymnoascus verrucosus]OBT98076.1 hypothetical protein VE01_03709 [Pseudogymnoascus verrucosus]
METTNAPPQGVEEIKQQLDEAGTDETGMGEEIARLYLDCPSQSAKDVKSWLESTSHFHRFEKIFHTPSTPSSSVSAPHLRIPTTILLPLSSSPAEARAVLPSPPPEPGLMERISVVLLAVSPASNALGEPGTVSKASHHLSEPFLTFLSHPAVSSLVDSQTQESLLSNLPKRYTVYTPLALLPTGSLSSDAWKAVLDKAPPAVVDELWTGVLAAIMRLGGEKVTHLAINHPIPGSDEDENIIRAPSHLHTLFGDFGPAISAERWALGPGLTAGAGEGEPIGEEDFENAFWVRTRQNGIFQSWAPRWTMFSRGNVTEKARVLRFGDASWWSKAISAGGGNASGGSDGRDGEDDVQIAVDLYAGIGYFTLSYLSRGYAVLAWEINPFSIEGLRRGAVGNGFEVLVVKGAVDWEAVRETVEKRGVVVFAEDNQFAWTRFQEGLQELGKEGMAGGVEGRWRVRHVNLGLLPSSRLGWEVGGMFLGGGQGGWMHVHENVKETGRKEMVRGEEIVEVVEGVVGGGGRGEAEREEEEGKEGGEEKGGINVEVRSVAMVKGFGPGINHLVFDVWVGPTGAGSEMRWGLLGGDISHIVSRRVE